MAYGTANVDLIQSSTANVPVQFNDGNGTQVGTLCRAWVNFNGTGTVAIRASFNVSSITDNGTGDYTVNFTTAMPDANYGYSVVGREDESGTLAVGAVATPTRVAQTTTAFRVLCATGSTKYDFNSVGVAIFR